HSLVYQAINEDAVDIIEIYSTDANISRFGLRVLKDDLGYFPQYQAVWVARKSFADNHPAEWKSLRSIEGRISEEKMRSMNAAADVDKKSFAQIASGFLGKAAPRAESTASQILLRTREHLWLVGISLFFSVLAGIPLGILAARFRLTGQAILVS